MFRQFQQALATGKFTLLTVAVVALVLWLPGIAGPVHIDGGFGLWTQIPDLPVGDIVHIGVGFVLAALSVYLMAELNNRNLLLRITSRMLSSLLAILITVSPFMHSMHPGLIAMVLTILSYFFLFAVYQRPFSRGITMMVYMLVSLASLVYPQMLYMVPVYWVAQGMLRSMSVKSFFASIIGVLLPYWMLGGVLVCLDRTDLLMDMGRQLIDVNLPDYTDLTMQQIVSYAYCVLVFCIGASHYLRYSYKDKTRTRAIYNVVVLMGIVKMLMLLAFPAHVLALLPVFMVDTAIIGGHYMALSDGKIANVTVFVLLLIAIAVEVTAVIFS